MWRKLRAVLLGSGSQPRASPTGGLLADPLSERHMGRFMLFVIDAAGIRNGMRRAMSWSPVVDYQCAVKLAVGAHFEAEQLVILFTAGAADDHRRRRPHVCASAEPMRQRRAYGQGWPNQGPRRMIRSLVWVSSGAAASARGRLPLWWRR